MQNPGAEGPKEAGHISGDAANSWNRPSKARDHEGRSRSLTSRQHQDNGRRVHAGDSRERPRAAINSRTSAVLAKQQEILAKPGSATCPNSKKWRVQVLEKIGSSGRTRTYNPPVNR